MAHHALIPKVTSRSAIFPAMLQSVAPPLPKLGGGGLAKELRCVLQHAREHHAALFITKCTAVLEPASLPFQWVPCDASGPQMVAP